MEVGGSPYCLLAAKEAISDARSLGILATLEDGRDLLCQRDNIAALEMVSSGAVHHDRGPM